MTSGLAVLGIIGIVAVVIVGGYAGGFLGASSGPCTIAGRVELFDMDMNPDMRTAGINLEVDVEVRDPRTGEAAWLSTSHDIHSVRYGPTSDSEGRFEVSVPAGACGMDLVGRASSPAFPPFRPGQVDFGMPGAGRTLIVADVVLIHSTGAGEGP